MPLNTSPLFASAGAALVAGAAVAAPPASVPKGQQLQANDTHLSERARRLIRIGEVAIAKENDAELDAFFAPDFRIHSPTGDAGYAQLKAAFKAYRAAFKDFKVTRQAIIENGDFAAARTTMSGTFTQPWDTPVGRIAPNGKYAEWELINVFRYDARGRLAEEWVQYDYVGLLRQLGVELQVRPAGTETGAARPGVSP